MIQHVPSRIKCGVCGAVETRHAVATDTHIVKVRNKSGNTRPKAEESVREIREGGRETEKERGRRE